MRSLYVSLFDNRKEDESALFILTHSVKEEFEEVNEILVFSVRPEQ